MFPGVPASFFPKSPSPTSRGEGGLAGKECTFLYCSHFSFVTLGCNTGPKASSKIPWVQSGCSSALRGGAVHLCVPGYPLGPLLPPLLPFFSPLLPSWNSGGSWRQPRYTHPCGTVKPIVGGFAGQHRPSELCSKLCSITLLIWGTVESKAA